MTRNALAGRFTLLIPTYNRPADLARLLAYLQQHEVDCAVRGLDSSAPDMHRQNAETVARTHGDVSLERFDPATPPWEKFCLGAEAVQTPYCSMCADDDLVIPGSLPRILGFLDEHPDYGVAHGWYFTFYRNAHIGITSSVYRGASLDGTDAVDRLYALFRNYEAVTYGVYRTNLMQTALRGVRGVESMLGKELLGGALSVASGKVARLPFFYYGRSLAPSQSYNHWHPLDFLASSPEGFAHDYDAYRAILISHLKTICYNKYSDARIAALVDLIHFRYLSEYVKPRVMEYLIEQVMADKPKPEIMQGLWAVLMRENQPALTGAVSGLPWLRRIRDRFFPRIRMHHLRRLSAPGGERKLHTATAGGQPREYLFYREFLESLSGHAAAEAEIATIAAALDRYE